MDIIRTFVTSQTSHQISVITDSNGDPVFRADELGRVLEMGNIHSTLSKFKEGRERGFHSVDTSQGPRQVTVLTESGVYRLLYASRKPIAEPFRHWVEDVLKSIRKTGRYDVDEHLPVEDAGANEEEKALLRMLAGELHSLVRM